jgi:1,4-dihydroxy-2-naphthoyl-CoA hydrolase
MNKNKIIKELNAASKNTLLETIGIQYVDVGEDILVATMPVNKIVHQPMGLLHGGASVTLSESVGSAVSHLSIDSTKYEIRGLEITANHLKSKKNGLVTATARIIHKGRTIHLVEIKVEDEEGKLISLCKLTNIILSKK